VSQINQTNQTKHANEPANEPASSRAASDS
jgi:hypothetical protein